MKSAVQNKAFSTNKTLNIRGKIIHLDRPKIMGVLNITPDSFFDGGKFLSESSLLEHTEKMLLEGATFIDVGGYSSRPGAADVPEADEKKRALFAIKLIAKKFPDAIISIDTFRSAVANACIQEGASIINDISGGSLDPNMYDVASKFKVPYILMHMRGNPQNMTQQTNYSNLIKEITDYFHQKIFQLRQKGIKDIIADPGFGFAKSPSQSFTMLRHLNHFNIFGLPILAGLSRKSMIWKTLSVAADNALNGTTVLNSIALLHGASILRVHDVREAAEVIKLVEHLKDHEGDN